MESVKGRSKCPYICLDLYREVHPLALGARRQGLVVVAIGTFITILVSILIAIAIANNNQYHLPGSTPSFLGDKQIALILLLFYDGLVLFFAVLGWLIALALLSMRKKRLKRLFAEA